MIFIFNNYSVDSSNFILLKNNQTVAVEPQVFNLIVYLIEHRDHLVSRQEIFNTLWSGREVTDATLSNHIKSARNVLGDNGQLQRVIKTIHGRGYQFIVKIEDPVGHALLNKSNVVKRFFNTLKLQYLLIMSVLIILNLILWNQFGHLSGTKDVIDQTPLTANETVVIAKEDNKKSIAVLAFKDLSPKQDQEYFSDGISEELLNLFTKVPNLRVVSRTSSFSFKNKDNTAEEIGKQLNVTHIMEGSVRKFENKLRVTAQLIRVSDGSHLMSETYDYTIDDLFQIQDDIAQAVTKQLKLKLANIPSKTQPANPKAYTLYLQALFLIRQNTEKSIRKAAQIIGQSISIDPNYSPSWVLFSRILYTSVIYSYKKVNKTGFNMAKTAALKAVELDETNSHAYAHLSLISNLEWDFESSKRNIDKALLLNPNSSTVKGISAYNLQLAGKPYEDIELLLETIKLNQLVDHHYLNLGAAYLIVNQPEKAYEAVLQYDYFHPNAVAQHGIMSFILYHQGKYQAALDEAEKEVHEYWQLSAKIVATHALGRFEESDVLLAQYEKSYSKTVPAFFASMYAYRGEITNAFKWLEIAYEQKDPSLIVAINYLPFRKLWDDERWDSLIAKIGLPKGHWLL